MSGVVRANSEQDINPFDSEGLLVRKQEVAGADVGKIPTCPTAFKSASLDRVQPVSRHEDYTWPPDSYEPD